MIAARLPWVTPGMAAEALRTGTGEGVRIAVIDSGIDAAHPEFASLEIGDHVAVIEDRGHVNVVDEPPTDVYGHGTAVASVIHRIAPRAVVGSFRVLDARNLSRTAVIRTGVREAIRRGYHILNCSFGCRGLPKYVLPHKEWIDQAYLEGRHVVAACNNADPREPEWPAHFTSVIAVGVSQGGDGSDPATALHHHPGQQVEFSAPGENVTVAWTGGTTRNETGSSFAAPHVSALLARVLSVHPDLPPAHVIDLLPRLASATENDPTDSL